MTFRRRLPASRRGGARVGRATARALAEREIDYRIVEMQPERIRDREKYVEGNAADLATLERAGLRETPARGRGLRALVCVDGPR